MEACEAIDGTIGLPSRFSQPFFTVWRLLANGGRCLTGRLTYHLPYRLDVVTNRSYIAPALYLDNLKRLKAHRQDFDLDSCLGLSRRLE